MEEEQTLESYLLALEESEDPVKLLLLDLWDKNLQSDRGLDNVVGDWDDECTIEFLEEVLETIYIARNRFGG